MLKTKYHVSGHTLSIFNLHSLNFVTNRMWKENIDMWLAQVEETGPAIFGGDMNTWNAFRFDYVDGELKRKGFLYAEYKEFTMLALDHLWTRDINVISSVCDTNIHTSDHYPVTIRFTFDA